MPAAPPHVVVIGDSITVLTRDDLRDRISDHRFAVDIRAVNGATAREMVDEARRLAAEGPADQVIINLGTNDVMQQRDPSLTLTTIRRLIGLFGEARCVHLVTVNEGILSTIEPPLTERIRTLNDGLFELAGERRGVDIIDWSAIVRRYLDAGEPDGSITYETVHPTDLGQVKLAAAYRDALRRCAASDPGV